MAGSVDAHAFQGGNLETCKMNIAFVSGITFRSDICINLGLSNKLDSFRVPSFQINFYSFLI